MTVPHGGRGYGTPTTGLPDFNAPVPVNSSDPTNIWNLPTELQNQPGGNGPLKLWYNIGPASKGHIVEIPNAPVPYQGSGDISELNPAIPGEGSASGTHNVLVGAHGTTENMETPGQILTAISALQFNDRQKLMNIQALMATGVWGSVDVNGVFDKRTEDALINAMVQYHKTTKATGAAMSFMDYLQSAGTSAAQAKQQQALAGATPPAPPNLTVDDPTMIAASAQSAAMSALGESLSTDQINKFIAQFQAEQRNAQLARYHDVLNRTGGTVTAPDLSASAMAFAQQSNPQAYQQNNRTQYLDALVNMMGGNRPAASEPVAPVSGGH